jgi:hypothetical protein
MCGRDDVRNSNILLKEGSTVEARKTSIEKESISTFCAENLEFGGLGSETGRYVEKSIST